MKVAIVGAGPGDPELITVKGRRLLEAADIIIYAGSLVNPELLAFVRLGIPIRDSSGMTLEEIVAIYAENADKDGLIVRLHTGDPSLYGAIQEQIDFCAGHDIPVEVVPGVSSVFAAAAALKRELTLPGLSQTLILTRAVGRTPVPEAEGLVKLGAHGATMAIYLSATLIAELVRELMSSYGADCPVRLVHHASWPDQKIIEGTLADIETKAAGLGGQAMILVGHVLDPSVSGYGRSRLYDPEFSHRCRKGGGE